MARAEAVRIGELARRSGVSVRTLHWYDEIGLLSPSRRSEAGHRLYTTADVQRLQQVLSLRQLGLSLDAIRETLARPDVTLERVLALQATRLRERIALEQRLCARLDTLAERLRERGEVSLDEFMQIWEVMQMVERYYTPEQLAALEQRRRALGDEHIGAVEAEWPALIEQVRAARDAGVDPSDPHVQALARRWRELVQEFSGGDPGIERSVRTMWQQESAIHGMQTGPMRELMEYVSSARAAGDA